MNTPVYTAAVCTPCSSLQLKPSLQLSRSLQLEPSAWNPCLLNCCKHVTRTFSSMLAGPTIALAMGERGQITRLLAAKYGGHLTFAALSDARASAPGQPTIAQLQQLYGFAKQGPNTKLYGIMGNPIHHSKSPLIHNTAFRHLGGWLCETVLGTEHSEVMFAPVLFDGAFVRYSSCHVTESLGCTCLSVALLFCSAVCLVDALPKHHQVVIVLKTRRRYVPA
jgi:hypothetical protein